jgi:hypothetical protein
MGSVKQAVLAVVLGAALLLGSGGVAPEARAGFIATLMESGPNVVVTGSGTLNLTDLPFVTTVNTGFGIAPFGGGISIGPSAASADMYSGTLTGPSSFGGGGVTLASSGSGDRVAMFAFGEIYVPEDYVSGDPLSSTSTYDNQTLGALGVIPGIYVWTWGTGANEDSFTLNIVSAVPEPATLLLVVLPLALTLFCSLGRSRWLMQRNSPPACKLFCLDGALAPSLR